MTCLWLEFIIKRKNAIHEERFRELLQCCGQAISLPSYSALRHVSALHSDRKKNNKIGVCLWSVDILHCEVVLLSYLSNKMSADWNWWLEHCVPSTWEEDLAVAIGVQLSEKIIESLPASYTQFSSMNLDLSKINLTSTMNVCTEMHNNPLHNISTAIMLTLLQHKALAFYARRSIVNTS